MQTVKVTIAPLRISSGNFYSLSYCISQKSRKYQKSLSQKCCLPQATRMKSLSLLEEQIT